MYVIPLSTMRVIWIKILMMGEKKLHEIDKIIISFAIKKLTDLFLFATVFGLFLSRSVDLSGDFLWLLSLGLKFLLAGL